MKTNKTVAFSRNATNVFFHILTRCNLKCRHCDTKYAWREGREMTVSEVLHEVPDDVELVTITGGEPLLQAVEVEELTRELKERGHAVLVETNGTIRPSLSLLRIVDIWSVSPKLEGFAGFESPLRFPVEDASYFKFVIAQFEDMVAAMAYCDRYGIPYDKVIVQPNGLRSDYVNALRELAEWNLALGGPFRVLPQLHRLIWGRRRRR